MTDYSYRLTIDEMVSILDKEIKWCHDNPDKAFSSDYRKGFINGLIQAKYLLVESNEAVVLRRIDDSLQL